MESADETGKNQAGAGLRTIGRYPTWKKKSRGGSQRRRDLIWLPDFWKRDAHVTGVLHCQYRTFKYCQFAFSLALQGIGCMDKILRPSLPLSIQNSTLHRMICHRILIQHSTPNSIRRSKNVPCSFHIIPILIASSSFLLTHYFPTQPHLS